MERIILHCDLNNFFASVTLLENQTLKNLPVAICGSKEERHGIVLAKNEVAKKFGVKTAEAIWEAQAKCPELIMLPPNYRKYEEFSKKARDIYRRYTDLIEPFGIDECWLDVTGSTLLFGNGEEIAHRIRNDIKNELGITVSVGVSFNKVFAKLGSDYKKPDAVTVISRDNFKSLVWKMPVGDLLFVGKNTVSRLNSCGIFTIGDLAICDENTLERLLGKTGGELKRYATGEENSPVAPDNAVHTPKSIGRSVTTPEDITSPEQVWKIFLELAEDISRQLREHNLYANGITVHTRTTSLKVQEFSHSLDSPTAISMIIAKKGMELFEKSYNWQLPLRSVGIRAIRLTDTLCGVQQDVFGEIEQNEKLEAIEDSLFSIRKKFGNDSIVRGRNLD